MFGHDKPEDSAATSTVTPTLTDDATSTAPTAVDELSLPVPTTGTDEPDSDVTSTGTSVPAPEATAPESSTASSTIGISGGGDLSNLSSLKQDALHELSPLIGHLDQSPDEKYETAKMVYEETKDQSVLTAIYEAAKNLPDDKAKAEAIYDVIKKINELK
ncbi:hypothetical protein BH10PAT3_BH10PAT3_0130 [soil metagenome]